MSEAPGRGRLEIMRELLAVTTEMIQKPDDVEFLLSSVDRRQALIEEFELEQKRNASLAPADLAEAKRLAQEVVALDKDIAVTLEAHRDTAKTDLTASNHHQRVLGYVNKALSSSGSYMDYKK